MAARNGLCFYLGKSKIHPATSDKLLHLFRVCLDFHETLRHYSVNCLKLVDAVGTNRVSNILFPQQVFIRRATIEDCDAIYAWRNSKQTRRYAFNAGSISTEDHREWYRNTIESSKRILLIGEIGNKPIGVLCYDFVDDDALISIYLVPDIHGQGIGSQLIKTGTLWIHGNYPNIRRIKAEILSENMPSVNAFVSAGFTELNKTLIFSL